MMAKTIKEKIKEKAKAVKETVKGKAKPKEKEPKSFGNKRNRITEEHRQWTIERYRKGWANGYSDPKVKIFPTSAFAYHKVEVVFWQTDADERIAAAKIAKNAGVSSRMAFKYISELRRLGLRHEGATKAGRWVFAGKGDAK